MPPQIITLTVEKQLAYTSGQAVIVVDASVRTNNCIGSVAVYSAIDGTLVIENIVQINGTFSSDLREYIVNLTGIVGSAGPIGPTGPTAVQRALSSAYYYLSSDRIITGPAIQTIIYDRNELSQTQGQFACRYDSTTGILTNNTSYPVTLMVSGQVTTDNTTIDYTYDQPAISIIKGSVSMFTSAAISFKGSVFSTTLILHPTESLYISYSYAFPAGIVHIKGGTNPFNTYIVFTQLDNVQGPTGSPGQQGGFATIFDGGSSNTVYIHGPVFDCGNSTA